MTADLAPYVPRLVVDWQEETPSARHRAIDGTLVFTDLSGFTAMSERLSKLGKLGAEELVLHLHAVFSELLDVAGDLGGSLIKFGGDALLVFFWGDDHALRGPRAAWEMQDALRRVGRIQTSAGRAVLRMSVGIHSGITDFFLVGDSHRELYVTGPGATTTVKMESAADAKEVLLSPATAATLDPRLLGEDKGGGVLLKRAPELDTGGRSWIKTWPDHLDPEPFVPVSLREQLLEGGHEPEHRAISAFFIHAADIDAVLAEKGPEAAADRLEAVTTSVQRHFSEHGVTFLASDVYHDGPKILGCTGAPVSWGNDEERVLRALRAVVDDDHGADLRIGVNRGHAFSGEVGPRFRRTYVAMGDVVNTAARVCARAGPDEILATASVLDRSVTIFDTEELPPFPAKGKSLPLVAHRVGQVLGSQREHGQVRLPLHGRAEELARLQAAFEEVSHGEGRVVELVGEAGIGKSRLVDELHAQRADVPFLRIVCEQYEAATPYHPFGILLGSLLGERSAAALRSFVDDRVPELSPWLPLLAIPLDVAVDPTPEVDRLDPQFVQARLHESVATLVQAVVEKPAIWLIDDAHWMDEASTALLAHLAGRTSRWPLLLAVARRAVDGGATLSGDDVLHLELGPLPADASGRVVQAACGRSLLPQQVAALAERGGGNPLFLRELAASMCEDADVEDLPESIEALVGARIDRLPPGARRLLRQVSVLGMRFDAATATAVAEDVTEDAWRGELSQFVQPGPGGMRFRHALVRDVAYQGLSYRARRDLHRRAGELIEGRIPDPEQEAELLSLHFHQAKDWERSWRYSRAAAQRAEEKYAYLESAQFWRRAAEDGRKLNGVDDITLARTWQSAGEASRRGGDLRAAEASHRPARTLSRADVLLHAELCRQQGELANFLGENDRALRWYRRGLRLLECARDGEAALITRAQLWAGQAELYYERDRYAESVRRCEEALRAVADTEALDCRASIMQVLHVAQIALGTPDRAESGAKALDLATRSGNLRAQASVLGNLGMDAHAQGELSVAIDSYRKAHRAQLELGNVVAAAVQSNNIAEILFDLGHPDEAISHLVEALSVFRAAGAWYSLITLRNLGRALAATDRFEEAYAAFDEALAGLKTLRAQEQWDETSCRKAEALLLEGRREEAVTLIDALLPRTSERLRPLLEVLHEAALTASSSSDTGSRRRELTS